jgi:hypothetical protein
LLPEYDSPIGEDVNVLQIEPPARGVCRDNEEGQPIESCPSVFLYTDRRKADLLQN